MRQWGFWQRNEGGIEGVKGGWGIIVVRVKGVYMAGMDGGWVSIMELVEEIQGMNVVLGFP
jgi:hypothetical protein